MELNLENIELFDNWVILKNPYAAEELRKKNSNLEKLPPSQQKAQVIKDREVFNFLEVIAVGDTCKKVSVGDKVFTDFNVIANTVYLNNEQWILLREQQIIGISEHAGTQENI